MDLLDILKLRFEENRHRHPELDWETVEGRLRDRPECRTVLQRMEDTGGIRTSEPVLRRRGSAEEEEESPFRKCRAAGV